MSLKNGSRIPKVDYSLKFLIQNPISVKYLKSFLKERQMSESLQFLLDVQKFKKIQNYDSLKTFANKIFSQYIKEYSNRQVNLVSNSVKNIEENLNEPKTTIFDESWKQIFNLLEDNLLDFCESSQYQKTLMHFKTIHSSSEFMNAAGLYKNLKSFRKSSSFTYNLKIKNQNDLLPLFLINNFNIKGTKITCIISYSDDNWCGCSDGTILLIKQNVSDEFKFIPLNLPSPVEGSIKSIIKKNEDILILTENGNIILFEIERNKISKFGNSENFYNFILKLGNNSILLFSQKSVEEWVWNDKKKKFLIFKTKNFVKIISSVLLIKSCIWIGDQEGGITIIDIQSLNEIKKRILISQSPVIFLTKINLNVRTRNILASCSNGMNFTIDENALQVNLIETNMHNLPVVCSCDFNNYVILGSEDSSFSIWDKKSFDFNSKVENIHNDSISCVSTSSDNNYLFVASQDKTLSIWRKKDEVLQLNHTKIYESSSLKDNSGLGE